MAAAAAMALVILSAILILSSHRYDVPDALNIGEAAPEDPEVTGGYSPSRPPGLEAVEPSRRKRENQKSRGKRESQELVARVYITFGPPEAMLRSGDPTRDKDASAKQLEPARTSFLFNLPVGSLRGSYSVSLADPYGRPVAEAAGASSRGKTLKVVLDLRGIPAGSYHLCIRRASEIADCYPVEIR
jgi:hypothetical protein